ANERYLDALAVVGEPTPSHRLLDPVSKRQTVDGRHYRALRPISPEDSGVFRAVLKGEFLIQGFRNGDLRAHLAPHLGVDPVTTRKASARVSRLLRLLRAHGLIYKVPKTNYHRITKLGQQVMTTATNFPRNRYCSSGRSLKSCQKSKKSWVCYTDEHRIGEPTTGPIGVHLCSSVVSNLDS